MRTRRGQSRAEMGREVSEVGLKRVALRRAEKSISFCQLRPLPLPLSASLFVLTCRLFFFLLSLLLLLLVASSHLLCCCGLHLPAMSLGRLLWLLML